MIENFDVIRGIIFVFIYITLFKNMVFLILNPLHPIKENIRYLKAASKYKKRTKKSIDNYSPKVSLIVPAWNEEVGIVATVESLLDNGSWNIEILVIDDGSKDNTLDVIKRYKKTLSINKADKLKIIYQENGGKGAALNNGIKNSEGEIIVTIDADSILKKNSITNLVKYYLDPRIMAVVGNVVVKNANNFVGLLQQLEYYFGFYNKRAHAVMGAEYIFGGACATYRKKVFDDIGYFDEVNKTEDIEMSIRTKAAGMKSTFAEDVVCYTEGASNIFDLIKQRVRWKKGRLDTFLKYKHLFFSNKKHHNFMLTFFVLPFSVLTELQLLLAPIAISTLIVYSLITFEFISISIGIFFIIQVYLIYALFNNQRIRPLLLLSAPFTWAFFYILDFIEYVSLWKSLFMYFRGEEIEWQNWKRKGIKSI